MAADLIFTPLNIGSLTVKNRIFRSSISGRFDNERFIRARSAPETHGAAAMKENGSEISRHGRKMEERGPGCRCVRDGRRLPLILLCRVRAASIWDN